MIWHQPYRISDWKNRDKNTIHTALGIEITEITDDTVSGKMPIDQRTVQPMQILHGGASVVLAESLGSIASAMIVNPNTHFVVGQMVSANHVRPGVSGWVYGTAQIVHLGQRSHIWNIDILNDENKLVCTVRLTMAVVEKKKE